MPAIDIDVLYAYLKPTDWLKASSNAIISKIESGVLDGYTSIIAVTELEIVSKRDFDVSFSNSIYANIKEIKNIGLKVLTEDVVSKAVGIREKYGLNIFDSIHAATALLNDKIMISTDDVFDDVKGLNRIDPRTIG